MLTVHHLEKSRSQRVLWALEELGLDYQVVRYARDPATLLAPESLRSVHPLGKSPVLVDGDRVLAESAAILEYVLTLHPSGARLQPVPGSDAHLRYRYWMHYAEGSLMPLLVMKLVASRIPQGPMPFFVRKVAKTVAAGLDARFVGPNLERHLTFVEDELARSRWFAGDELTACDIQMSYPMEAAVARAGITAASHPNIVAFVTRIQARPSYQRALARGA